MAECKLPFVAPSSMEQFMHQFFPPAPHPVKQEPEEVREECNEVDFGASTRQEYSPEEHAATSSERDESPDTLSAGASPDGGAEESVDQRPVLNMDDHFKQLMRLQESLKAKLLGGNGGEGGGGRTEDASGPVSPPSSESSKRGAKIDYLASRLGAVTSSSPPSALPSAVSSILGHSAFHPQMGALSALAMQLAASQSAAAAASGTGTSVIQPNPLLQHLIKPEPVQPMQHQQLQHLIKTEPGQPMQQQHLQQTPPSGAAAGASVGTTPQGYAQSPKRKRQRRNPVWPYFIVEEGIAKCKQCAYSTKSVFSTNLKVHLRSHHRPDYEKVIEAEDQLNLNALLLSGNAAAGLAGKDNRKRSLPPMTSSILMTISKLAAAGQTSALQAALANQQAAAAAASVGGSPPQAGGRGAAGAESDALAALRQTFAANQMQAFRLAQQGDMASAFSPMGNLARQHSQSSLLANLTAAAAGQSPSSAPPPSGLQSEQQQQQHSTPPTPSPAPTPNHFLLQQFGGLAGLQGLGAAAAAAGLEMPQPKRRRLRRHPVWMFFKDLEDRMVGCINCNFRTGSAFSTNLKMHLKAHHKEDYSKVLKLEDDMRIEEGIFGAPNKIKSELIDFIRGGGNASTPNAPCLSQISGQAQSPLMQQLIAANFNGRASPMTPGSPSALRIPSITINNNSQTIKREVEDLSMSDKLAALVGLHPMGGMDTNENGSEMEKNEKSDLIARLFNNTTQTQSLSMSALKAFNGGEGAMHGGGGGGATTNDTKSCTSSSVDGSTIVYDDRKCERDRAIAKFASTMGENVVSSDPFKELLRVLIPDYEVPEQSVLASLLSSSEECHSEAPSLHPSHSSHSERAEPTESPSGDEMHPEEEEHAPTQFEQLLQSLSSSQC